MLIADERDPDDLPRSGPTKPSGSGWELVRIYGYSLLAILLFAVFPVISVMLTSFIATPLGCKVSEAAIHPCVVTGVDIGGVLNFMGVLGWLMLATLPIGAICLAIWIVALIVHLSTQR